MVECVSTMLNAPLTVVLTKVGTHLIKTTKVKFAFDGLDTSVVFTMGPGSPSSHGMT